MHTEANKYLCGPRLCKKPNGEDWVLGAGGYGRVVKGVRGDVQVTLYALPDDPLNSDVCREVLVHLHAQ